MRSMVAQSLAWGACFIAGLVAPIKSSRAANCALYARAETGGDVLLRKPFGPDALIEAVQQALQPKPASGSGNVVPLRRGDQSQSR